MVMKDSSSGDFSLTEGDIVQVLDSSQTTSWLVRSDVAGVGYVSPDVLKQHDVQNLNTM